MKRGRYVIHENTSTAINPDRSNSWVDPIIGARLSADLSTKVMVNLRGDIGGFGVGSDFTWNGSAFIGLSFYRRDHGSAGLPRALYRLQERDEQGEI